MTDLNFRLPIADSPTLSQTRDNGGATAVTLTRAAGQEIMGEPGIRNIA